MLPAWTLAREQWTTVLTACATVLICALSSSPDLRWIFAGVGLFASRALAGHLAFLQEIADTAARHDKGGRTGRHLP